MVFEYHDINKQVVIPIALVAHTIIIVLYILQIYKKTVTLNSEFLKKLLRPKYANIIHMLRFNQRGCGGSSGFATVWFIGGVQHLLG